MPRGSVLKGPALLQALAQLEEARELLEDEHAGTSEETTLDRTAHALDGLDGIIDVLRVKAGLSARSSSLSLEYLAEFLGITSDILCRRSNNTETMERGRVESAAQGGENCITSEQMYRHLDVIQSSVPSVAAGRLWIDTILLRVSSMVASQTTGMVLNMEHIIPEHSPDPSIAVTATIKYTAVLVPDIAFKGFLLFAPTSLREKTLVVVEAKPGNRVVDSIPHAVNEMHSAAVSLKQKIIRGALTNGFGWIFIVLCLGQGTFGGVYSCSLPFWIPFERLYPFKVIQSSAGADVVTGILAHWLQHSFQDIDGRDEKEWFTRVDKSGNPVDGEPSGSV